MGDGPVGVLEEALFAVLAVPPRCVVPTVDADPTALVPGELVDLHVETTSLRVEVTVAGWNVMVANVGKSNIYFNMIDAF